MDDDDREQTFQEAWDELVRVIVIELKRDYQRVVAVARWIKDIIWHER